MREDFLHYLWRYGQFDARDLRTTAGQPLFVVHPGQYNAHAGPDFTDARLRMGGTLWAGNVEMHLRSSDWYRHGHQNDPSYENVLLHVVWEHDAPVLRADGSEVPALEMCRLANPGQREKYKALLNAPTVLPCAAHLSDLPAPVWIGWLDRMMAERLEQKSGQVDKWLQQTGNHWEEAFYRGLARAFGLSINADPFERLAAAVPFRLLARYCHSRFHLEALLFGAAGLLADAPFADEYPNALYREWRHLQVKYRLGVLTKSEWKFLRLRPANFPTLRLAQFAAFLHGRQRLWEPLLAPDWTIAAWEVRELSPYWSEHYRFGHLSPKFDPKPGQGLWAQVAINAVAPFLYRYGRHRDEPAHCRKAQGLLENLSPEKNAELSVWQQVGRPPQQAAQSQAQLHLSRHYCSTKRCLHCGVGVFLMKKNA
jgi:hypothetical protein